MASIGTNTITLVDKANRTVLDSSNNAGFYKPTVNQVKLKFTHIDFMEFFIFAHNRTNLAVEETISCNIVNGSRCDGSYRR